MGVVFSFKKEKSKRASNRRMKNLCIILSVIVILQTLALLIIS
jgi:hypothetical protein